MGAAEPELKRYWVGLRVTEHVEVEAADEEQAVERAKEAFEPDLGWAEEHVEEMEEEE